MPPPVHIRTRPGFDLDNALVIVGAPTLGHVGTITGQYVVDALHMPLVGGVESESFPPAALISKGRSSPAIRVHAIETACGLGLECSKLVVITGAMAPRGPAIYKVADAIVAWCVDHGASALIVPDGLVVEGRDEDRVVRGVAATKAGLEFLAKGDIEPMESGMLGGITAAILLGAEHKGLNTLALLAESNPELPDARAAARIVEILDQVVPEIKIDTQPLLEQAQEIEEHVRQVLAEMASQNKDDRATRDPMIS